VNRLVSLQNAGSSVVYDYDADGIRVSSSADGADTGYLADKNRPYAQVLEERDEGPLIVSYVYGDDLISQNRNGSVSYCHYDGLGSVTALTDGAGNVTDSYVYDAFGNLRDRLGTTVNHYLYTGEQYDPNSGFCYLRARHYMPETGRFATTDPFEGHPGNPVTLHRYLYANDNPVMFVDPGGEFAFYIASVLAISSMFIHGCATSPMSPPGYSKKCCVKSFKTPASSSVSYPDSHHAVFDIKAEFIYNPAQRCYPKCCEYRQEVKGVIEEPVGTPVQLAIHKGYLQPNSYGEDGGTGIAYGYRFRGSVGSVSGPGSWSVYDGSKYSARDRPGMWRSPPPPSYQMKLKFRGRIIDTCSGNGFIRNLWVTAPGGGPVEWGPVSLPR